jgi:hypothetical protein
LLEIVVARETASRARPKKATRPRRGCAASDAVPFGRPAAVETNRIEGARGFVLGDAVSADPDDRQFSAKFAG